MERVQGRLKFVDLQPDKWILQLDFHSPYFDLLSDTVYRLSEYQLTRWKFFNRTDPQLLFLHEMKLWLVSWSAKISTIDQVEELGRRCNYLLVISRHRLFRKDGKVGFSDLLEGVVDKLQHLRRYISLEVVNGWTRDILNFSIDSGRTLVCESLKLISLLTSDADTMLERCKEEGLSGLRSYLHSKRCRVDIASLCTRTVLDTHSVVDLFPPIRGAQWIDRDASWGAGAARLIEYYLHLPTGRRADGTKTNPFIGANGRPEVPVYLKCPQESWDDTLFARFSSETRTGLRPDVEGLEGTVVAWTKLHGLLLELSSVVTHLKRLLEQLCPDFSSNHGRGGISSLILQSDLRPFAQTSISLVKLVLRTAEILKDALDESEVATSHSFRAVSQESWQFVVCMHVLNSISSNIFSEHASLSRHERVRIASEDANDSALNFLLRYGRAMEFSSVATLTQLATKLSTWAAQSQDQWSKHAKSKMDGFDLAIFDDLRSLGANGVDGSDSPGAPLLVPPSESLESESNRICQSIGYCVDEKCTAESTICSADKLTSTQNNKGNVYLILSRCERRQSRMSSLHSVDVNDLVQAQAREYAAAGEMFLSAGILDRAQHCFVRSLELNPESVESATALARAVESHETELRLDLGRKEMLDNFRSPDISIISALLALKVHALTTLQLSSCLFGPQEILTLVRVFCQSAAPPMLHLDLSHNHMGDEGLAYVLFLIAPRESWEDARIDYLEELITAYNSALCPSDHTDGDDQGPSPPVCRYLSTLDVQDNDITVKGVTQLACVMQWNQGLQSLNLSHNPIDDDGVITLAMGIKKNQKTGLRKLNLAGIKDTSDMTRALVLEEMRFHVRRISDEAIDIHVDPTPDFNIRSHQLPESGKEILENTSSPHAPPPLPPRPANQVLQPTELKEPQVPPLNSKEYSECLSRLKRHIRSTLYLCCVFFYTSPRTDAGALHRLVPRGGLDVGLDRFRLHRKQSLPEKDCRTADVFLPGMDAPFGQFLYKLVTSDPFYRIFPSGEFSDFTVQSTGMSRIPFAKENPFRGEHRGLYQVPAKCLPGQDTDMSETELLELVNSASVDLGLPPEIQRSEQSIHRLLELYCLVWEMGRVSALLNTSMSRSGHLSLQSTAHARLSRDICNLLSIHVGLSHALEASTKWLSTNLAIVLGRRHDTCVGDSLCENLRIHRDRIAEIGRFFHHNPSLPLSPTSPSPPPAFSAPPPHLLPPPLELDISNSPRILPMRRPSRSSLPTTPTMSTRNLQMTPSINRRRSTSNLTTPKTPNTPTWTPGTSSPGLVTNLQSSHSSLPITPVMPAHLLPRTPSYNRRRSTGSLTTPKTPKTPGSSSPAFSWKVCSSASPKPPKSEGGSPRKARRRSSSPREMRLPPPPPPVQSESGSPSGHSLSSQRLMLDLCSSINELLPARFKVQILPQPGESSTNSSLSHTALVIPPLRQHRHSDVIGEVENRRQDSEGRNLTLVELTSLANQTAQNLSTEALQACQADKYLAEAKECLQMCEQDKLESGVQDFAGQSITLSLKATSLCPRDRKYRSLLKQAVMKKQEFQVISKKGVRDDDVKAFQQQLSFARGLKSLDFRDSRISDHGAVCLLRALDQSEKLKALSLANNCIHRLDIPSSLQTSSAATLTRLRWLDLSGNQLSSGGIESLVSCLETYSEALVGANSPWPLLEFLDLSENPLCDEGVAALSRYLILDHRSKLKELRLSNTKMTNVGATAFVPPVIHCYWLSRLDLSKNPGIDDDVMCRIDTLLLTKVASKGSIADALETEVTRELDTLWESAVRRSVPAFCESFRKCIPSSHGAISEQRESAGAFIHKHATLLRFYRLSNQLSKASIPVMIPIVNDWLNISDLVLEYSVELEKYRQEYSSAFKRRLGAVKPKFSSETISDPITRTAKWASASFQEANTSNDGLCLDGHPDQGTRQLPSTNQPSAPKDGEDQYSCREDSLASLISGANSTLRCRLMRAIRESVPESLLGHRENLKASLTILKSTHQRDNASQPLNVLALYPSTDESERSAASSSNNSEMIEKETASDAASIADVMIEGHFCHHHTDHHITPAHAEENVDGLVRLMMSVPKVIDLLVPTIRAVFSSADHQELVNAFTQGYKRRFVCRLNETQFDSCAGASVILRCCNSLFQLLKQSKLRVLYNDLEGMVEPFWSDWVTRWASMCRTKLMYDASNLLCLNSSLALAMAPTSMLNNEEEDGHDFIAVAPRDWYRKIEFVVSDFYRVFPQARFQDVLIVNELCFEHVAYVCKIIRTCFKALQSRIKDAGDGCESACLITDLANIKGAMVIQTRLLGLYRYYSHKLSGLCMRHVRDDDLVAQLRSDWDSMLELFSPSSQSL